MLCTLVAGYIERSLCHSELNCVIIFGVHCAMCPTETCILHDVRSLGTLRNVPLQDTLRDVPDSVISCNKFLGYIAQCAH
jgi:hypothetical protein